ncbi:MAG: hypothetical protein WDN24_15330 [Sphingomonas sp.]
MTLYRGYDAFSTPVYSRSATYDDKSQVTQDVVATVRSDGTYEATSAYYYNAVLGGSGWDGRDLGGAPTWGGVVTRVETVNRKNGSDGAAPDTRTVHEYVWAKPARC